MKKYVFVIVSLLFVLSSKAQKNNNSYVIQKGDVTYDFSFAELAIQYFETGDSGFIDQIVKLDATDHIFNHAKQFNYNVPKNSKKELVNYLLSPFEKKKEILPEFKRNLKYVKDSIAETDLSQKTCKQYLPKDFNFSSKLFFAFGYDLGVVYGNNASVNLAHPHYLKNMSEIKYYSIHELHHAGFVMLKNNEMPSLEITNYKQMAEFIEYLTHLEGMGTYAPLELRKNENALNADDDYVVLQDSDLMTQYEKVYFDIYFHFKNNPEIKVTDKDWDKIEILSNNKRLWYRVGAYIAQTIDQKLGREKLTNLISEPSENFIKTYLDLIN